MPAQPKGRRQLNRAVELDAFGLHPARGEMPAGHFGVFGGDPDMAPRARVLVLDVVGGGRDHHPAMTDIEVERRVDFGIIEFHQYVVAGDPELCCAERDKGRDIEAAYPDEVELRLRCREAQLSRLWVVKLRLGLDADAPQ